MYLISNTSFTKDFFGRLVEHVDAIDKLSNGAVLLKACRKIAAIEQ
jgi:hypothetical protein